MSKNQSLRAPSRGLLRSVARRASVAVVGTALVAALVVEATPSSQAAGTGHITGKVTGPGGVLEGVTVSAYLKDPSGGGWSESATAQTNSQGVYDIGGLDDGQYTLGFSDEAGGSAQEYWDDKPSLSLADDFTVSGPPVPDKDAVLAAGHHLRGTVRGDGGAPLADIEVSAYPTQASGGEVRYDRTDAQGAFDIGRLPAGTYKVGFRDFSDRADPYATEFWEDQPDLAQAGVVTVGDDLTVLNAVLGRPVQSTPPTSQPTQPAVPAVKSTALPRVKGQARVGGRLRVVAGSWSPTAVTTTYQWLVKGKPIKGATRSVLRLKAKWRGEKLTVRVTAAASGYTPVIVTTKPSKKIKPRTK